MVLDFGHRNILRFLIQGTLLLRNRLHLLHHLLWWSLVCHRFAPLVDQGEIVLLQQRRLAADEVLDLLLLLLH